MPIRNLVRFVIAGFATLLVARATVAPAQASRKYALLVGVTELQNMPRKNWLSGPSNDLAMMRSVMKETFGFKDEDILTLSGKAANRANIERCFKSQLIDKAGADDFAMFYYSGHGTQVPDQ